MNMRFSSHELTDLLPYKSKKELHEDIEKVFFKNGKQRAVVKIKNFLGELVVFRLEGTKVIKTFNAESYSHGYSLNMVHVKILSIQFDQSCLQKINTIYYGK